MSRSLILHLNGPQGHIKTWKLKPNQSPVSFGSSRLSDIRVPEDQASGVDGLFECRDGHWVFVDLRPTAEVCETTIQEQVEITRGNLKLDCVPQVEEAPIYERMLQMLNAEVKNDLPLKNYHMLVVSQNKSLLEIRLRPESDLRKLKSIKSAYIPNKEFSVQQAKDWAHDEHMSMTVSQRMIQLNDQQALKILTKNQIIDRNGEKTVMATTIGGVLLLGLFLISPNAKNAKEVAVAAVRPKVTKVVTISIPKSAPAKVVQVNDGASGGGRAPASVKDIAQSRLSKLISKISAAPALSKNLIVVKSGMEAGKVPTGQALAALSNKDQEGRDWKKETRAGVGSVSTGNGTGDVGHLGSLKSGKTGQSNIGLLEEESEVSGGLEREVIAQYIKSQSGQILYCYERQLSANPDLFGKVAVKFTIDSNGKVAAQNIRETTLKDRMVENCILQKVAKWQFPEPKGGSQVLVTYPFLFKSTN